jgi:lipopolysaccharide export system protein LptA
MAEITNLKGPFRYFFSRYILCVLIFLLSGLVLSAQQPKAQPARKKIVLQNADEDNIRKDPLTGKDIHHLKGNVKLLDNETKMSCDSAIFYTGSNQVNAFIKIHIEQGDTLNLYGDYLFYDGKLGTAFVKGNVELIDKETHLYTDSIHYDVKNRIAKYTERGRIKNADNTLTSIIGVYYAAEKLFHFKDSVKIVNPKYVMTADTMDYNSLSEIAYFTGPTHLVGDSIKMYCERGWYDTKKEITSVWKNAMIDNRHQIIHGDSLYFNNNTGFGESFRNVIIQDTVNNIAIEGNYAWVYKEPERFLVTDKAVFIQISDQDSLFLHADTINSISKLIKVEKKITEVTKVVPVKTEPIKADTIKTLTNKTDSLNNVANKLDTIKPAANKTVTVKPVANKTDTIKTVTNIIDTLKAAVPIKKPATSYRLMKAFHNVRIFSKDLQAKCDSLSYSFQDSVIRLYTRPVIWSAENQLTADSMALFTKNRQSDRLELYNNAFIAMFVDTIRYNQIKGRSLTGYFKNNELFKIDIKGNGESVYYLLDGEAVGGRNQSKCANMEVRLEKGKVSEIYEYENPDGFIDPPLPANPVRLDGFKWLDLLRPKKMKDIFIKTK